MLAKFQLVPQNPLIWFYADEEGSWSRLKIKLELNNLFFDGSLVPASPKAVKDAVKDLVSTCRAQGLEIEDTQSKISYTSLVLKLESLGLIVDSGILDPPQQGDGPLAGPPAHGGGPLAGPPVHGDGPLAAKHRSDVSHFNLKFVSLYP